jgi:hypothetical protein
MDGMLFVFAFVGFVAIFWLAVILMMITKLLRAAKAYRVNTLWLTGTAVSLFMFVAGLVRLAART